jgi:hypothetical protein
MHGGFATATLPSSRIWYELAYVDEPQLRKQKGGEKTPAQKLTAESWPP